MPPAHYAVTEAMLAACAFAGSMILARNQRWMASASLLLIGAAALVGTIRFASGDSAGWQTPHQYLSQQGGILAIALMTLSVVTDHASSENNWAITIAAAGVLIIAALIFTGLPARASISSGLLLITTAILLATWTGWRRALGIGLFLLALANGAIVRQTEFLSDSAAWHIYHGLLAVFAVGYTRLFATNTGRVPTRVSR